VKPMVVVAWIVRTLVGLGLIAGASAIAFMLVQSRPRPGGDEVGDDRPSVQVMVAEPVRVQRQWRGYGTARSMDTLDVPARVSAVVVEVPPAILEGASIEAGTVLARLDPSDFEQEEAIAAGTIEELRAQLDQLASEEAAATERRALAEEAVVLAEDEYARVREAVESQVAKQRELDQARQAQISAIRELVAVNEVLSRIGPRRAALEAQIAAQTSRLRLARLNVERCTIRSDIDGVLEIVDVEPGEDVSIGRRVARVVNLDRMEVPIRLPASARSSVAIGDGVTLTAATGDDGPWLGTVSRIAPRDDEETRTFAAYVELDQADAPSDRLTPGRFVEGELLSHESGERWVVPRRAVQDQRIRVADADGTVRTMRVESAYHLDGAIPQLGLADLEWVVLREPLPEGTLVVVEAGRRLPPGSRVIPRITGADAPATDGGDVATDRATDPAPVAGDDRADGRPAESGGRTP